MYDSSYSRYIPLNGLNFSTISKTIIDENRYVKQHYLNGLNEDPNEEHLGHPINAYHFVRHVAYGWEYILNELPNIISNNVLSTHLGM